MLILDTSQIQARKPNPQAREISRLTWHAASIPQNAIPFTERRQALRARVRRVQRGDARRRRRPGRRRRRADHRHRRRDAAARDRQPAPADQPARRPRGGAPATRAREPRPGLRRALLQHPDARSTRRSSPARSSPPACACSTSATCCTRRRSPTTSRPPRPRAENGVTASDFAMSQPAFVPERREIWFTDGTTGFYVLRVSRDVWPGAPAGSTGSGAGGARRGCLSRRAVGRRGIGRVRLGMTRKGLARRVPAPRRKTKRSWRWCVKGGTGHRSVLQARPRRAGRHHRGAPAARRRCASATRAARAPGAASSAPPRARPGCSASAAARSATRRSPRAGRSPAARCCAATCAPPGCAVSAGLARRPVGPEPGRAPHLVAGVLGELEDRARGRPAQHSSSSAATASPSRLRCSGGRPRRMSHCTTRTGSTTPPALVRRMPFSPSSRNATVTRSGFVSITSA